MRHKKHGHKHQPSVITDLKEQRKKARSLGYESTEEYEKGLTVIKRLLAVKDDSKPKIEGDSMHTCHAIACDVPVPPEMLMCKSHWFRVPLALRNQVWAEYRKGITKRYCEVAKSAVIAVAEKEGRTVTGREREILLYDMIQTED